MRIHIRQCDDWIAVYKNGEPVWDNHSCPLTQGLDALGIPYVYEYFDELDIDGKLPDGSEVFPESLNDEELFVVPEGIAVERVR